jgi:hypothetical protein
MYERICLPYGIWDSNKDLKQSLQKLILVDFNLTHSMYIVGTSMYAYTITKALFWNMSSYFFLKEGSYSCRLGFQVWKSGMLTSPFPINLQAMEKFNSS